MVHYQPIRVRLLPTTLLSSFSKYRFHIRLDFSSSLRHTHKKKTDQQSIHLKLSMITQWLLSHTHNPTLHKGGWRGSEFTQGGRCCGRTLWAGPTLCSRRYGDRLIGIAGTPEHPAGWRGTSLERLRRSPGASHWPKGRGLLATDKFGSVSLDLLPEIWRTDGLVAPRQPHTLNQLCKLYTLNTWLFNIEYSDSRQIQI